MHTPTCDLEVWEFYVGVKILRKGRIRALVLDSVGG
jgi:hypothetical protein